ncbi:DUF2273 domain-containing protein [Paenibacillus thermoaerophilus]|uniref:DUF2273 domain-containing protein n=1 Tax=Paenibacillus thermoaerophilus TaxID=1215385 RepID=A0ABW2V4Z3_9BACL|nr:DUF2273 domain-containing protein [Paenibacillus thermoaerophilus]TMV18782.1 DUF2273 domain-containing protein [Paenibacillus thermoaerophilus]
MNRFEGHIGKTIGVAAGLLLSVVYLFFGFWDMLVVGVILFLGYYFGHKSDRGEPFIPLSEWLEWLRGSWRWFR